MWMYSSLVLFTKKIWLYPIHSVTKEYFRPLSAFLVNLCAIIGGVFTVASLIDSFIYSGHRVIAQKMNLNKLGWINSVKLLVSFHASLAELNWIELVKFIERYFESIFAIHCTGSRVCIFTSCSLILIANFSSGVTFCAVIDNCW